MELKTNKLYSTKTLIPVDYFSLPFIQNECSGTLDQQYQNVGVLLQGDRIHKLPYRIGFLKDVYCEQLGITNAGRGERKGTCDNRMVAAIHNSYGSNWIVDNLPALKMYFDKAEIKQYVPGAAPIGFVSSADGIAYLNNHVSIILFQNTLPFFRHR